MEKNSKNFFTDMADERAGIYKDDNNLSEIEGVKIDNESQGDLKITKVEVLNEKGKSMIEKEIGSYITVEVGDIKYIEEDEKRKIIDIVAQQIKKLLKEENKKSILVIGLGNVNATPDALGPKVVEKLNITRHLLQFAKQFVDPETRSISGISPGVLGTTGIETSEIASSIVKDTNPDIIIAIDSLCSSSVDRIGKSFQLSTTGITPGGGIGNERAKIDEGSLGRPVIAIGVPTVVDMATITSETIGKVFEKNLADISSKERREIIAKSLNTENYIVTPKEIDELIDIMSDILASAINSLI